MSARPGTLGDLRQSGWEQVSTKEEMRRNLLRMIRDDEERFPGIHGYERTVIPAIENAVLARHDMILLGLRGQAKTRILRALAGLLDETIPIIKGCDINDSPYRPVCKRCRRLERERGDDLDVDWIGRERRYREKLATPDVTVADLIGDIDPVKAANLRLEYSDEEVIHYGIIPRTNRGIFAINELPDLAPRIQVALLNILEERDLQIRGFPVRIPMDMMLVFSANPEDYTSRGNIITPLKDRIDSQVLTHYPRDVATARRITRQEAWLERNGSESTVEIPDVVGDLIERIAFLARESELVDQSSGVSARMPISATELLLSNLERRAQRAGETRVYPRLSDLMMLVPAITGKVEMVYEGEQQGAEVVARNLIGSALLELFESTFPPVERAGSRQRRRMMEEDDDMESMFRRVAEREEPVEEEPRDTTYEETIKWFAEGNRVTVSDEIPFDEYYAELSRVPGL
ncbi:MAG: AAA family ATPase, partial [Thermoanaerobaculia bacterium]|nr:AAA family ATPase [Thermoanaerobaculia bacterium]